MKKRSQVSVEFLTIFGFAFLMTIPVIIIFQTQSAETKDALATNHIRNIGIKIIDKAESIYYLGEPSKTTLEVYFPEHIQLINISGRTIIFEYLTSKNVLQENVLVSQINLTGSLSANPGIHYIKIEASGDAVSLSE